MLLKICFIATMTEDPILSQPIHIDHLLKSLAGEQFVKVSKISYNYYLLSIVISGGKGMCGK